MDYYVVQVFGGLGRFEERPRQPLPLVELVDDERFDDGGDEDDPLDFLHTFRELNREVQEFEGEDYDAAQTALTTDPEWDGDHCEFCRRADTGEGHHRFWKQIRMGHYIHSVLTAEDETGEDKAA